MKCLVGGRLAICFVCLSMAGCSRKDSGEPSASFSAIPQHAMATAPSGTELHPAPTPDHPETIFGERGSGIAEVVEKDGRFQVVHQGRAGKAYAVVGQVALSPDGRRCAYGAIVDGKWRMVLDGKEGAPFDTVKMPVFSPDGAHVAYQAMAGELWHLVVDTTMNGGTRTRYLNHEFSAGSSRIAFVTDVDDHDRGRLVVSDLAFRKQTVVESDVSAMILDSDRTRLAAVATVGAKQRVVTIGLDKPGEVGRGAMYDAVSSLAFGQDGVSLAYLAEHSGRRLLVLDDREVPVLTGHVIGAPVIIPERRGVGTLVASLSGSVLLRGYFVQDAPRESAYEEAEGLVYDGNGRSHAYSARRGASWFVVLNGIEGPPFDRVVTPVFSPDGRYLAYRARKDGKRFVVVADTSGGALNVHSAHEQVFPVRFTSDGKSIAYGVKDGRNVAWRVEAP